MGYVEKTLGAAERILYKGKFHWLERLAAWILFFIPIFLIRIWTTEIVITNQRLIYKRGWIFRKTDEININRLEETNLRQGIVGRIFGYGKLTFSGVGVGNIELPIIAKPLDFRKALIEAQAKRSNEK